MTTRVRLASHTRPGHRHRVEGRPNEDAHWLSDRHPGAAAILIVADGMGGHARPEEAARIAVAAAREALDRDVAALDDALAAANAAVLSLAAAGDAKPPGATLSVAVIADGALRAAHVGDGSLLLCRNGRTLLLAGGEERRSGNRPAQHLGQRDPLAPEGGCWDLQPRDRVLLCTDGVTRAIGAELPELLSREVAPDTLVAQLLAAGRAEAYEDDATVALAMVDETGTGRPPLAEPARPRSPLALLTIGGAALLLAGFGLGWLAGRGAPEPKPVIETPPAPRSEQLLGLPSGNLTLLDPLNGAAYLLPTQTAEAPPGPLSLQGLRIGRDGRLQPAGTFSLDATHRQLTTPEGARFAVEFDPATGAFRPTPGAPLLVRTLPTPARLYVDGVFAGESPLRVTLPAGSVELEARWAGVRLKRLVTLRADAPQTVELRRP